MTTETKATYTRGPWRIVDRPSRGLQIEWGGDADGQERPICHMRWTDGLRADVEARVAADARLIAAAPELLDALKRVLAGFDALAFVRNAEGDGDSAWAIKLFPHLKALADAIAAIAKTEGADQPSVERA